MVEASASLTDHELFGGSNAVQGLAQLRLRLLNLTNRNRLLNFRHPKRSCVRVIDELPDELYTRLINGDALTFKPVPKPSRADELAHQREVARQLGEDVNPANVPPLTAVEHAEKLGLQIDFEMPAVHGELGDDGQHKYFDKFIQTLLFPVELEKSLSVVRSAAQLAIEESGANLLYLAFGFLEWTESDSSQQRHLAPLLLLPVTIKRGSVDRETSTRTFDIAYSGEDLVANLSLREKLVRDFGLDPPQLDEDTRPEEYFLKCQSLLGSKPTWRIRRYMTLSLFQFGKVLMYLDLDPDRWPGDKQLANHGVVSQFFEGARDTTIGVSPIHSIDDCSNLPPIIFDADSSQHSALIDALDGRSLVIEGPPGTGKSQTITNLIAAALAQGKTILFVSEKLAALEVVRRRLDEAGLGDFCLELHSHRTQKRALLDDIERRMKKKGAYFEPVELGKKIELFTALREQLKGTAELMNTTYGGLNRTVHQLLSAATRYRQELALPPHELADTELGDPQAIEFTSMAKLEQKLATFRETFNEVTENLESIADHPYYGIRNAELYGYDQEKLFEAIETQLGATTRLSEALDGLSELTSCNVDLDLGKLRRLAKVAEELPALPGDTSFELLNNLETLDDIDLIDGFCRDVENYHSALAQAAEYFSDPTEVSPSNIDNLEKALLQAESIVDNQLRLEQLGDVAELCNATIRLIQQTERTVKRVCPTMGIGVPVNIADIRALGIAVDCARAAPIELLELRSPHFEKEGFHRCLLSASEERGQIREMQHRLSQLFDLEIVPDEHEVKLTLSALSETGVFRWFSSDWRKAKRIYKAVRISKGRVNAEQRRLEVANLLAYQTRVRKFGNNQELVQTIGPHFKGVSTRFEDLARLRSWYEKVREALGYGIEFKGQLANRILELPSNIIRALCQDRVEDSTDYEAIQSLIDALRLVGNVVTDCSGVEAVNNIKDLIPLLGKSRDHIADVRKRIVDQSGRPDRTVRELKTGLTALASKLLLEDKIKDSTEVARRIKKSFQGVDTDVRKLQQSGTFAREIFALGLPADLNDWILSQSDDGGFHSLRRCLNDISTALAGHDVAISSFCDIAVLEEEDWLPGRFEAATTDNLIARFARANENHDSLIPWLDYVRASQILVRDGFAQMVGCVERERISSDQLISTYRFCVFDAIARELTEKHPELVRFVGTSQEKLREQFVDIDREIIELERERIGSIVDQKPVPQGIGSGPVRDHTEWQLLLREVKKQKRHIPIRQLVRRAGGALQALKPCFMMGPLSVAQYLEPGSLEFDLVVMDEASQLKPEDAIGAVARGQQLIVVGDPKQLPPTSFFDRVFEPDEEGEGDATAIEEAESILDVASWLFQPVRQLQWHYRSRHQSLIAFSNHYFYGDSLVVFPSPKPAGSEFGVSLVPVANGQWERRRNFIEAKTVADAAIEHMVKHPGESLGVATMNSDQRDLIEELIERRLTENPAAERFVESRGIGPEPFFVKNLENVQGDERDVVLVSFTYGPNEEGRVMQRFGPINSDVGWRRLNVLFTRAKKRVIAFSSMKPEDIIVGPNARRGVVALRDYLSYARDGTLDQPIHTGRAPESDFEIAVASALRQRGFECEAQLGVAGYFIDVVVKHPDFPGGYIVGIECDGATYHSGKSVRDRDRLRQSVLEDLGWTILRIWSTDWFRAPERETERVIKAIELQREVDKLKAERFDRLAPRVISGSEEQSEHDETQRLRGPTPTLGERLPGGSEVQDYFLTVEEARKKLIELREQKIRPAFPNVDPSQGLLRKAMLDALLRNKPTTGDEFRSLIPLRLREETSREQVKAHLEDVLEIISEIGS